jgi:hypothetical protein
MLTLNIDYEVLPDRLVTIKLPETVRLGRHEMVIILEENDTDKNSAEKNTRMLMKFSGAVSAFNGVDGVEYQKKLRSEWN